MVGGEINKMAYPSHMLNAYMKVQKPMIVLVCEGSFEYFEKGYVYKYVPPLDKSPYAIVNVHGRFGKEICRRFLHFQINKAIYEGFLKKVKNADV